MKYIEELRGKHKGENIWVFGTGPSVDAYPLNWFKGLTCIGVNWAFSAFVDIGDGKKKFKAGTFYSVHAHRQPADWIAKRIPHFLKNCLLPLPPKRRRGMNWWQDYNNDPYYMRWGLKGGGGVRASQQDIKAAVDCIMRGGKKCKYVCEGTTLHWAIQAAAVLGAKKIWVTGAEGHGGHMKKHGSLYPILYKGRELKIRAHTFFHTGTKSLADALRPHGVKVVYYYYGKGEQRP